MQETNDIKMFFYFDESGSPAILGHHGKNLVATNSTSKTFSVGYVQTDKPHDISVALEKLRKELMCDDYLKAIPSMQNLKNGFHANKDCLEVREKVFKLIKQSEIEAYIIVARKDENIFRQKFNMNQKRLYKFLVSEILKNRVHLYKEIDVYFSALDGVVSTNNMREALTEATDKFLNKWGKETSSNINIYVQQPSQIPMLQITDYILWAVFRLYERGESRYFDFIKEKIKLVHDIFDIKANKFYGAFYTAKNPLTVEKIKSFSD